MEDKRRYRLPALNVPAVMDMFWPISHRIGFTDEMQGLVHQRQSLLRSALEAVDLVISPSQFLIDKFREFDFNTTHFVHLRQGLASPSLPDGQKQSYRDVTEPLRVTYVGQLKYHKGIDILIEAVIRLSEAGENIELDLWGKESESPEYVSRLKNRSMPFANIRWNGSFTGSQIWEILRKTDVMVVPSRWYENSPNSILEAFSMRVPVIATNLGGMAELVTHKQDGLLFEMDDIDGLCRHLQLLLNDSNLLPTLQSGVPLVKTLDQEMAEIINHYGQYLHMFSGLLFLVGLVL
jgi:glycosyltransferase involved in cell wall biosynthesis